MALPANASCSWYGLLVHLQERILSLLPLTMLLLVVAVSRALRRLIRSLAFHALLSLHRLDAFLLLSPRFTLSSRAHLTPARLFIPSPSLVVTTASLPRFPAIPTCSYLLAILAPRSSSSSSSSVYTIVAITTDAGVRSYTLDSADPSPRWAPRGDPQLPFVLLGNAAVIGDYGRLFMLSRGPDALLVFDLAMRRWELLLVVMPHDLTTAHLFVFDGQLLLVCGVERLGVVERVVVWRFNNEGEAVGWREVGTMPADVFDEFLAFSGCHVCRFLFDEIWLQDVGNNHDLN